MPRAIRSIGLSLLVTASALLASPIVTMAVTWTVDDPSDGVQCLGFTHTTISAAVAVASVNPLLPDIIVVCDGDYFEQVVIDRSLTLQAAQGQTPTIHFPLIVTDPNKAVVRVTGLGGLMLGALVNVFIDGFIITGPGPGGCDSVRYGIRVDGGATATITDNLIKDIQDTPFGGCQNGIGILVGRQADGTTGHATIRENLIQNYQKGGIVVDNLGSSAIIVDNVITGVGRTEIIAQNGVQVSRGAMVPPSNLQGNTVTGNFYLNRSPSTTPAVATGILYFQAGEPGFEGPINSTNKLRHNQINVSVTP